MTWMDPDEAESRWEKQRREKARIPMMDRGEYLRKYPNGGPERFSGTWMSEEHREFEAAIKRRDRESGRGGRFKFLWAAIGLLVLFCVMVLTGAATVPQALFLVLMLILAYCFVEMVMNLPR